MNILIAALACASLAKKLFLAVVVHESVVAAIKVPSRSMRPTIDQGDHLLVSKAEYTLRNPITGSVIRRLAIPRHGDIVVFRYPGENPNDQHHGTDFVKRCVGLPGDVLEMRDRILFVNGAARDEPFTRHVDPIIRPRKGSGEYCNGIVSSDPKHAGPAARPDNSNDNWGPYEVPSDHIFLLGDNREESFDCRCYGPVPLDAVRGRVFFRYAPPRRIGRVALGTIGTSSSK